jgi:hypothetical protein
MNNILNIKTPAENQAKDRMSDYGINNHGLTNIRKAYWNLPTEALYEEAIFRGEGHLSLQGPIVVNTGKHTARAANDKIIVSESSTVHIAPKNLTNYLTGYKVFSRVAIYLSRIATPAGTLNIGYQFALSPNMPGTVYSPATCLLGQKPMKNIADMYPTSPL